MATIEEIRNALDEKLTTVNNQLVVLDQRTNLIMTTMESDMKDRATKEEEQSKFRKRIENRERQTNIIIHGIQEDTYRDTLNKVLEILADMDIKVSKYCIASITKLGKKDPRPEDSSPSSNLWKNQGPLLVSLISVILKQDILRNKAKLTGKNSNISIKEDLPLEVREQRKSLSVYSEKAKKAELKVHMRGNKLMINGQLWTLEDLQSDTQESYLNKPKRGREEDSSPNKDAAKKKTEKERVRKNSMDRFLNRAGD